MYYFPLIVLEGKKLVKIWLTQMLLLFIYGKDPKHLPPYELFAVWFYGWVAEISLCNWRTKLLKAPLIRKEATYWVLCPSLLLPWRLEKNWDPFLTCGIQSFKIACLFQHSWWEWESSSCPETARLAKLQLWTDLSLLELVPTRREQSRGEFVPQFLCVVAILCDQSPTRGISQI